ncbi:MAG: hypothetical protein ACK56I_09110 [bacterium]
MTTARSAKGHPLPLALHVQRDKAHEHGLGKVAPVIGRVDGRQVGAAARVGIHVRLALPQAEGGLAQHWRLAQPHGQAAPLRPGQGRFRRRRLAPEGTHTPGADGGTGEGHDRPLLRNGGRDTDLLPVPAATAGRGPQLQQAELSRTAAIGANMR